MISVNDELITRLEEQAPAERRRIAASMVQCFSTAEGRVALQSIMTTLRMFREAGTEEERHLQNAGKRILYLMGAGTEVEVVDSWLQIAGKSVAKMAAKKGVKK